MPKKGYKQTLAHRQKLSAAMKAKGIRPPEGVGVRFKPGERPWNWRGKPIQTNHGYLRVSGSTRYVHSIIAEEALGRPLKKGEVVHHINGNKIDNRNYNLLICANWYNRWLHERMSRLYAQEHFGGI